MTPRDANKLSTDELVHKLEEYGNLLQEPNLSDDDSNKYRYQSELYSDELGRRLENELDKVKETVSKGKFTKLHIVK